MEFVNTITKTDCRSKDVLVPFIQILAPFAPHLGEELWSRAGQKSELSYQPWPTVNEAYLVEDTKTYAIQVNGKVRGQINLPLDVTKEDALAAAKVEENVRRHLDGKTLRREIFVPGRMINFVVG